MHIHIKTGDITRLCDNITKQKKEILSLQEE